MKNMWRNKQSVGIEVTSSRLSCVFLRQTRHGEIILEDQTILTREPAEKNQQSTNKRLIKNLKKFCRGSAYRVMSIPYHSCTISTQHFAADLSAAEIEFELQSTFPFDSYVDFGREENEKEGQAQYWCVAAKKEDVQERINLMKQTHRKLNCIEMDAYAILRVLKFSNERQQILLEDVIAIMHRDNTCVYFFVFKKERVIYGRMELVNPSEPFNVVLQRFLQFFDASRYREPIHQLIVTVAQLAEEKTLSSEMLGFQIVYLHPFNFLKFLEKSKFFAIENQSCYLIALGLALRGVYRDFN